MKGHLILALEAPMMSFGTTAVGEISPTAELPGASFLVGLIANALGWDRTEHALHARLQDRLVLAASAIERGRPVEDFQTAVLGQDDAGWTTRGAPEGRAKTSTFSVDADDLRRDPEGARRTLTHRRWRQARAGASVCVALRLDPADEEPTLDDVARAFARPARPLFLGRKPFVPSTRVLAGRVDARTARGALWDWMNGLGVDPSTRTGQWSASEGGEGRRVRMPVLRDWRAGVHAGEAEMIVGRVG